MDAFFPMLKNVILFVLLAVPGYVLVKTKVFKQEHSGILSKLLVFVGSPFFIVYNMLNVEFNAQTIKGLTLSFILYSVCIFAFYFISPIFSRAKHDDLIKAQKQRQMMRFCEIFSNNGFMGLPLALAVFPGNHTLMAYLIVCNIANNIFMYTMGVSLVGGGQEKVNVKKILLNPVLISFIIAIPLNLLNVKAFVPEIVTYTGWFNNIVTPLAMTVIGMKMAGVSFVTIFKNKPNYVVCLAKLVIFPVIGIALALLFALMLPDEKFNLAMCSLICFATPTAALASTFGDQFGGDADNAVIYTLGTTLLSVITIPLLYMALVAIL